MGSLSNCEHVTRDPNDPNYNADSAGDYVRDTAADPGLRGSSTHPYYNTDANCNYFGSEINCDGTPYQVDSALISNIMSYGGSQCKIGLSLGQAERIHYGIDNADPVNDPVKRALIPNPDFDLVLRNSDLDYGDKTVIVNEHTEIIMSNFPANDFGIANVHVNFLIPDYTPNTYLVLMWNIGTMIPLN